MAVSSSCLHCLDLCAWTIISLIDHQHDVHDLELSQCWKEYYPYCRLNHFSHKLHYELFFFLFSFFTFFTLTLGQIAFTEASNWVPGELIKSHDLPTIYINDLRDWSTCGGGSCTLSPEKWERRNHSTLDVLRLTVIQLVGSNAYNEDLSM